MAAHEKNNRSYVLIVALMLLVTAVFTFFGQRLGVASYTVQAAYVDNLFDDTKVHTIEIEIDEAAWADILSSASEKEYQICDVVIDGESVKNVGLRAKGNSSLRSVASSDSDRYSFKLEFDHYDGVSTYKGLDKLSLNNVIQDNTYMKEYITYHMFAAMDVASPLSSFASVTVNGELLGLYTAVEAVEDAFVQRNFSSEAGRLYKPETMDMDGQGEGGGFAPLNQAGERGLDRMPVMGGGAWQGDAAGSRNSDAALIYTDDEEESYQNIFDGAVFDITDGDKTRLIEALKRLNSGIELDSAVDIEQVLKYFVVHNFVNNFDSYTGNMLHNYYLRESDGLLSMIPWDYNLAFGGMGGGSGGTSQVNFPIDTPVSGTTLEQRPLLGKLLENETYLTLYHQYFAEFMEKFFDSGVFEKVFDDAAALIAPYVESDPTAFCTYEQFQKGITALKEYCLLRAESVKGQLDGTIPSTQSGQQAAQDTLISAGTLNVSDMGAAMGDVGFGGGGFGIRQGGWPGEGNAQTAAGTADSAAAGTNTAETGGAAVDMSGEIRPPAGMEAPPADGSPPEGMADSASADALGSTAEKDGTPTQTPHAGMPSLDSAVSQDQAALAEDGSSQSGLKQSDGQFMGQNFPGFGQWEGMQAQPGETMQTDQSQSLLLLVVSILVLIGGLAFAFFYRRKK